MTGKTMTGAQQATAQNDVRLHNITTEIGHQRRQTV